MRLNKKIGNTLPNVWSTKMIWMHDITLNNQVISCLSLHALARHFAISFIANAQPQTVGIIHYTNVCAHNGSVTNHWEWSIFCSLSVHALLKVALLFAWPNWSNAQKTHTFVSGEGQRKSVEKSMEMSQMFPSMVNDSRQSNISTGSLLTLGLVWARRYSRSMLQTLVSSKNLMPKKKFIPRLNKKLVWLLSKGRGL